MKLVNRLLVIAVIAFGSWFLVQQWDKVDEERILDIDVTEVAQKGEEIITEDALIVFEADPMDKPIRKIKPVVLIQTASISTRELQPAIKVVSTQEATITTTTTDVTVYLYEGGFDLSTSTVSAGTIKFNVRNDGRMSHEFAVEGIEDFGRVVPGEMKTFTLNLREGEYELFSPREVDLPLDMRETLTVESAK